ncbi:hypothetical protein D3Z36_03110 [Lachnospiraceae bacterium]|nr:hypothetical protein [Lachnospiraceae bacterium]
MDLSEKFGMSEGIADLWQELGISAGTAIVVLIALYFVIKWAVKNGMMDACKKIEEERVQHDIKAEKSVERKPEDDPEKNRNIKRWKVGICKVNIYEKH